MAFSVTNVGTAADKTLASFTITATIPNGSLIFAAADDGSAGYASGTIGDTLNTYTAIQNAALNSNTANGGCQTWYVKNCTALSGGTITYTKGGAAADSAVLSVCYITGADTIAPLDTAVTAQTTGATTTPSVTSGVPSQSGELFVGLLATAGTGLITQPGGFVAPPNNISSSGTGTPSTNTAHVSGGNEVNAGSSAITYSPTLGVSPASACMICAFKAAVADVLFAQASL